MAAIVVTMCSQLIGTLLFQASKTNSINQTAMNAMNIANMAGDMAIWLSFFLFVYEIKSVIVILSTSNMHGMAQALKTAQREKCVVVGMTLLMSTIYHGVVVVMITSPDKFL
jgi:hypothetical protein